MDKGGGERGRVSVAYGTPHTTTMRHRRRRLRGRKRVTRKRVDQGTTLGLVFPFLSCPLFAEEWKQQCTCPFLSAARVGLLSPPTPAPTQDHDPSFRYRPLLLSFRYRTVLVPLPHSAVPLPSVAAQCCSVTIRCRTVLFRYHPLPHSACSVAAQCCSVAVEGRVPAMSWGRGRGAVVEEG